MIFSVHLTGVFFLIWIVEESAGRHSVAPADGMAVVSLFIMPRRHASAKMWGYTSDEKKLPIISAIIMRLRPCTIGHALIIFSEVSDEVEYPSMTVTRSLRYLVLAMAPCMALPSAARPVSTIVKCIRVSCVPKASIAMLERVACMPGPISIISTLPRVVFDNWVRLCLKGSFLILSPVMVL